MTIVYSIPMWGKKSQAGRLVAFFGGRTIEWGVASQVCVCVSLAVCVMGHSQPNPSRPNFSDSESNSIGGYVEVSNMTLIIGWYFGRMEENSLYDSVKNVVCPCVCDFQTIHLPKTLWRDSRGRLWSLQPSEPIPWKICMEGEAIIQASHYVVKPYCDRFFQVTEQALICRQAYSNLLWIIIRLWKRWICYMLLPIIVFCLLCEETNGQYHVTILSDLLWRGSPYITSLLSGSVQILSDSEQSNSQYQGQTTLQWPHYKQHDRKMTCEEINETLFETLTQPCILLQTWRALVTDYYIHR